MITRIEIEKQEFFADGYEFPNTGPYERLCGSAYGEVDPKSRLNAVLCGGPAQTIEAMRR